MASNCFLFIGYVTNNLLAVNLSTALIMDKMTLPEDPFYREKKVIFRINIVII